MTFGYISILLALVFITVSNTNVDVEIFGSTAIGWEYVKDFLKDNILEQRDLGASVAIYHEGALVVDLWGGWFDQTRLKPYDNDTLQLVFSTTKGLVGIAAALCVQRGLLNYSELVTKYWPEYGINRKEKTTVGDILSHRAGLPLDSSPFEHYFNWSVMVDKLENEEPLWTPGTAHGYHSLTFGWLAGELIRRVDPQNRTFGEFVRDEIANPLNIEFYVGLPYEHEHRVSPLDFDWNENETFSNPYQPFNNISTLRAEIPAANGITNARSVARLYASLMGNLDNNKYKRLLRQDILDQATKSDTPKGEIDVILNVTTQFSKGFLLMDDATSLFGSGTFGYIGFGGSIGFAAPARTLSFAYVMNRIDTKITFDVDHRYRLLLNKIASTLDSKNGGTILPTSSLCFKILCLAIILFR